MFSAVVTLNNNTQQMIRFFEAYYPAGNDGHLKPPSICLYNQNDNTICWACSKPYVFTNWTGKGRYNGMQMFWLQLLASRAVSLISNQLTWWNTVYPKKYAHGFCFAVLCCGNTLTDFPISIRFTSLALWQSNDCPSASKATLMNMDKYFMWIYYERLHNHNKSKHNKTVCIFLGIYCMQRIRYVI